MKDGTPYNVRKSDIGYWVYGPNGRLIGLAPTAIKIRHLIPRKTEKVGQAKFVSDRQPFKRTRYGVQYKGVRYFPCNVPGAVGVAGMENEYIDMGSGEVFRYTRRDATLIRN